MAGLTEKQQRFVKEYLVDLNAAQAAVRAGYSQRSARQIAHKLVHKDALREVIDKAMRARSERTLIAADKVLEELAKIGFANAGDFLAWGPGGVAVRDKAELTREQQAVVAEVSATKTQHGGTVRVKLYDKLSALEKIGRHLGMFKERVEHTGRDGGPIQHEDLGELSDIERALRIEAILERARKARAGQVVDGGNADMGAPEGAADGGIAD